MMTADADKKYVDGYNAGFKHGQQKLHQQETLKCFENQIELYKEQIERWESWAKYVEKYMGAGDFDKMQTEGKYINI